MLKCLLRPTPPSLFLKTPGFHLRMHRRYRRSILWQTSLVLRATLMAWRPLDPENVWMAGLKRLGPSLWGWDLRC